jgi:hypothetical protein
MHSTIELARRVERAEIEFCAVAASGRGVTGERPEAPTSGGPALQPEDRGVDILDAGGARALYSQPASPLNKVLGLGLHGPVSDDDLRRIEAFYAARKSVAQIELCPLAYGDVAARLCARGYLVEAYENVLGRELHQEPHRADPQRSSIRVVRTTADQDDLWTRVVAEGFTAAEPPAGGAPAMPQLTLEQMVEMMSQFLHPGIRRYLVWDDDEPAGGGAAWLHEGILGIFGTATRAPFRRRGIQTAVTIASVDDARGAADTAVAVTSPGSTSQRTFERLGFQVLYTRTIFIKA